MNLWSPQFYAASPGGSDISGITRTCTRGCGKTQRPTWTWFVVVSLALMAVVAIHFGRSAIVASVTCTSWSQARLQFKLSLDAARSIAAAAIVRCFYTIDSRVKRKLHKERHLQQRASFRPRSFQRRRFCRLL